MSTILPFFVMIIVVAALLAAGCTSTPGPHAVTPTVTTVAATPVPTTAAPAVSWAGAWNGTWTEEGSEGYGIMFLEQTGTRVTGTYNIGTDTLEGTSDGNRLAGTWAESEGDENWTGVFAFEMSEDQNSFSGRWAYNTSELTPTSETWNGVRISAGQPWTGRWNTAWTDEGGTYTSKIALLQTGSSVTGWYVESNGTVQGTIEGDTLTGTWSEFTEGELASGTFEFVISGAPNSFTGKWATTMEDLANASETWDGVRA